MKPGAAHSAARIEAALDRVAAARSSSPHSGAPAQAAARHAVKQLQHQRFVRLYADLLGAPRTQAAARFFLDDLYGPQDFTARDAQFRRIVPALVRLFPAEVVATVVQLTELHALTETLDAQMAAHLLQQGWRGPTLAPADYRQAWQNVGAAAQREAQLQDTLALGRALDTYTRKPLLRQMLRAMRGPAKAAGLQALQDFLERGFESFRALQGAADFLACIAERERACLQALFNAPGTAPDAWSRLWADETPATPLRAGAKRI